MRDDYGRCFNCGRTFRKSRTDHIYCSAKCRSKDKYIHVPTCKGCLNNCKFRNEKRVYAPKECPIRVENY